MISLRTALVITTCATIVDIFQALGTQLDSLGDVFLKNLLKLTGQSKKLICASASNAIIVIIKNTTYHTRSLQIVNSNISDKNISVRIYSITFIQTYVTEMVKFDSSRTTFEKSGGLDIVLKTLKSRLQDASSAVRETSRDIFFESLRVYWPEQAEE